MILAKVKQLEWHNFDAWTYWAEGACGTYHVEERNGYWQVELRVGGLVHGVTATDDTTPSDLETAKAAAQADYEARIMAALEVAHHVNETPKSEHDSAGVLTEYTLAPHLQKIVDGAKTAPQWDMVNDRFVSPPADVAGVVEEAGKVLAKLQSQIGDDVQDVYLPEALHKLSADTIRSLIALATAQAAQIAGLEAQIKTEKEENRWAYIQAALDDNKSDAETALAAMTKERDELRARLEIDHFWVMRDGEMVREEGDPGVDGIECRDATIELLDDALAAERAKTVKLEKEVLRLNGRLWAIGHAAGIETKDDLMKDALAALSEAGARDA